MNSFKLKSSFPLLVFLFLGIFSANVFALTLPHVDTFDGSSNDGWSSDSGRDGALQINEDDTSSKTFDFLPTGVYADKSVTVTLQASLEGGWESTSDYIEVTLNTVTTRFYIDDADGSATVNFKKSLITTLDSVGDLAISIYSQTSSGAEITYIDYIQIIDNETAPVITPEIFTIDQYAPLGTTIGTVSTTPAATSFSILSGDIDSLFAIDSSGNITVASSLDSNSTDTYTLNIEATNAYGSGTEDITINLIEDIPLSTDGVNTREYTNVPILGKQSVTINGAILQVGNQLLCRNDSSANGSGGSDGDACLAPTEGTPNNSWYQYKVKVDTNASSPYNSMAKLNFVTGDEVVFARLYWSARINTVSATEVTNAKNIQIKGPKASLYTSLTSPNSKYNWHDSGGDIGDSEFDYAASTDVTDYVTTNGAGEYYVGGITSDSGRTGTYASWQLIVVVKNPLRSLKNIAIYDGFFSIHNSTGYPASKTVDAGGFITPTGNDDFDANLFIYAGETDSSYGDSSEVLKGDGITWVNLVDGAGTTTDVMNGSISSPDYTGGYRSLDIDPNIAKPNFKNVLGVDIDKLLINDKTDSTQQILDNEQTSTQIRLSSTQDRYSLNMFAFETEVFVPEFCYDYAYSQHGRYFTEENDGYQSPRLSGDVTEDEPIEMTIFLKSQVDGTIQIQNMEIDVLDINTTQATYIPNTADPLDLVNATKVALVGDLYPNKVNVTSGTASGMDYINNIPIGTLNQNEYFYLYYSLDPQTDSLDMPINISATYDLVLDSTSVDYTLTISKDIPLCSTDNFEYKPAKGIFNVAHNDYYYYDTSSGGAKHYNLPTQVTKREGNFKVLAMDENDFDELNFDHAPTIVAVEMIDAGAFHFTEASCKEMTSSISERVWVVLDENTTSTPFTKTALDTAITNGMTKIIASDEFYTEARQNTAFRITYNSSDENGSIPSLIKNAINDYSLNYTVTAQCNQDMDASGSATDDDVSTYCLSNMTRADLTNCMECLYGFDTRFICSRDNFAIRPEAFMLKLNDQAQTNPTTKIRFADDVSGVTTSPSTVQTEMAAGYQYVLEVNATTHVNNNSSLGYTRTFGVGSSDVIEYQWPTSGAPVGCNDEANSTISFKIVDGDIDLNTSLDQVGIYRLHMEDTSWTAVDNDPLYMSHHDLDATYFIPSATKDCLADSSTTQVINSGAKNGCNISSTHSASATALEYSDYDVEFHPYKFDLTTITPTVGLNHTPVTATSFVYMTDMNFNAGQDENMSYHLNGTIKASGENDANLSNYVTNCYAKPLDIDLVKSTINLPVAYQYRFHSLDASGADLRIDNADLNNSGNVISVQAADFPKALVGSADTIFNLNYNRAHNNPMNPEQISFNRYDVNCTTTANCTFQADFTNTKVSDGTKDLNSSIIIKHYYGRTHAPRNRFVGPAGNAFIYYEAYCNGTTGGTVCDKNLLQQQLNSTVTDDPRWFKNESHTVVNDGNTSLTGASGITQRNGARVTSAVPVDNVGVTTVPLTYDTTRGYPYKATMENNASRWLIYNQYDATVLTNEFEVEFVNINSTWAGEGSSSSTTGEVGSKKTNRRSMW